MGSAQSSHNHDQAYIIKISQSVIDRLERQAKAQEKEERIGRTTIKNEIPSTPVTPPPTPIHTNQNIENVTYLPSLTSLRVLQMKEKELSEQDNYWAERIENFKLKEKHIGDAMLKEFEKAEKEINRHVPRKINELKNYDEKKKSLLECYKKHPDELLLCSREVAEFADSVRIGNVTSVQSQKIS